MIRIKFKVMPVLFVCGALLLGALASRADTAPAPNSPAEQALLQQQLQDINSQITQFQQQLAQIQGQKNTLQNKIKQLKNQQAALALQVKATTLQLADLGNHLADTQTAISQNLDKSAALKSQLGAALRQIQQRDNFPLVFSVLAQDSFSAALEEIQNFSLLSDQLNGLLDQSIKLNSQLNQQATDLAEQQDEANNLLSIQALQQQQLAGVVSEQNTLLQQTKGRESDYQITLNDTQKRAADIQSRLYQLLGVSTQITFGQAAQIAQWASAQTGVRPAFLLAVLTQESNLGKNVGTCNRPGDPPSKSWRVVMKPDRDQQPFLQITASLGMDPDITPVSCPMRDSRGNQVGWGGAMGPAQFIPSTWLGYKDQVAAITGKPANPWDIRDAFLAAAIKLKAGGADTPAGEWAAALRYFSGSTNSKYSFYGDSVAALASQYQNDLQTLAN